MSTRIKNTQSLGRDYKQMLKNYFGRYLYGLWVQEEGGYVKVQVVYYDFKHVSTVRRELTQMMPEVEFTKISREFTYEAELWALTKLFDDELAERKNTPVIYIQRGDSLVKTSFVSLANAELNQLDLDDDDIDYEEDGALHWCETFDDDRLMNNALD